MHTTLDILEEPCQGEQSRWETASTTIGHGSYEGFWASSVAVGIVVEDDRIAGNPINHTDPSGTITWRIDSAAKTITARITVSLKFRDEVGHWTEMRKYQFKYYLKATIEAVFNSTPFRIRAGRTPISYHFDGDHRYMFRPMGQPIFGYHAPCELDGFAPKLDIEYVAMIGDWKPVVLSWPVNDAFFRDNFASHRSSMNELDEDDVTWYPGLSHLSTVHEFGHFLGLDHPGFGIPGITPNDIPEYAYSSYDAGGNFNGNRDRNGNLVDGPNDLMGQGNGMQPFYLQKWADYLNQALRTPYGDSYEYYVGDN